MAGWLLIGQHQCDFAVVIQLRQARRQVMRQCLERKQKAHTHFVRAKLGEAGLQCRLIFSADRAQQQLLAVGQLDRQLALKGIGCKSAGRSHCGGLPFKVQLGDDFAATRLMDVAQLQLKDLWPQQHQFGHQQQMSLQGGAQISRTVAARPATIDQTVHPQTVQRQALDMPQLPMLSQRVGPQVRKGA